MVTPRKPPEEHLPAGRPTKYDPKKHPRQAFKLWLLPGMTMARMANFFEITESTAYDWKATYPEFSEAIKNGGDGANAAIGKALFDRAVGYKHKDVHISVYMGEVIKTETVKHYPPDVNAAKLLLMNRDPENWREKKHVEHSGEIATRADRIRAARQRATAQITGEDVTEESDEGEGDSVDGQE